MEVLKKTEGGFDLAAAEHVLCWHINTALQIVNALRFKGNVAPFAVETQASAFSFLLFFLLFAEVQIFCIDCKTIFRLCQKPFECCPMCRRSVQTVAWDEHTPGLRVKPVEGVDAGVHACHEKAEKILGRIKKKNFWSEREIKLAMVHRALQLWWAAATTKSGAGSSALANRGLDLQWHACPWRMLTDAALTSESQEERCRFGCLQPRGC